MKIKFIIPVVLSLLFVVQSTQYSQIIAKSNFGQLYPVEPSTEIESNVEVSEIANLDFDNDGIWDVNDKCKENKENYNFYEDDDGCPDLAGYPDTVYFSPNTQIFIENSVDLTPDVTGAIQIDLTYLLTDYPNTFWIIKVFSKYWPEERAQKIKNVIDETTSEPSRTRIEFDFGPETKVMLSIDNVKARELLYK